jgi:hypothetical protein
MISQRSSVRTFSGLAMIKGAQRAWIRVLKRALSFVFKLRGIYKRDPPERERFCNVIIINPVYFNSSSETTGTGMVSHDSMDFGYNCSCLFLNCFILGIPLTVPRTTIENISM